MNISWPRSSAGRGTSEKQTGLENMRGCSEIRGKKTINKKIKYRRYRMAFTTEQINHLESAFKRGPYVNISQRQEIAEALNLTDRCVKVWFQNRRMREKQIIKEREEGEGLNHITTASVIIPSVVSKSPTSDRSLPTPPSHTTMPKSSAPKTNIVQEERVRTNVPFRPNYYQDISPTRDEQTAPTVHTQITTPIYTNASTNPLDYKASAEFSIDLCKKYQNMFNGSQKPHKDNNIGSGCLNLQQPISDGMKIKINPAKTELQDAPEDLSMKKFDSTNNQVPTPKNNTSDNHGVLPIYLNIPQHIGDRNIMWNQLTMPSAIIPNAVPAASISILPTEASAMPGTYYMPTESCNCCKCPKNSVSGRNPMHSQNLEPKYIINVIPYQNYHNF